MTKSSIKKLTGCCGLDCEKCDAYLATVHNDEALREKTAQLWSRLNKVSITPEMINCLGCRGDGVKTFFCSNLCEIRKCVLSIGLSLCSECSDVKICQILAKLHQNYQDSLKNLK